jgi:hypothetical protein
VRVFVFTHGALGTRAAQEPVKPHVRGGEGRVRDLVVRQVLSKALIGGVKTVPVELFGGVGAKALFGCGVCGGGREVESRGNRMVWEPGW